MSKAPYDEGFEARARDAGLEDNPHIFGTSYSAQWASGWFDQDRHMAAKESALEQLYNERAE